LTEDELLSAIIGPGCNNLCELFGWQSFHVRPAWTEKGYRSAVQGSGVGWPDLILVRDGKLLVRELKSDHGTLSDAQREWLGRLSTAGLDTGIWRPCDFDLIERTMRR
jgi:hypothetical protein